MSLQDHNSVIGCVTAKPEFEYGLKLINPARLSDFTTVNISGRAHCSTLNADLKEFIRAKFPINWPLELPNLNLVDFGYIEAGHGAKGRKIWLYDDDDVAKMYFDHEGKRKILLWCYTGLGSKKKERETLITYKGKEIHVSPYQVYDDTLAVLLSTHILICYHIQFHQPIHTFPCQKVEFHSYRLHDIQEIFEGQLVALSFLLVHFYE